MGGAALTRSNTSGSEVEQQRGVGVGWAGSGLYYVATLNTDAEECFRVI